MDAEGVFVYFDSFKYYRDSSLSLTDSKFWESRSPISLIFYKLFGDYEFESHTKNFVNDDVSLLYGQTVVYLAAFSFLAFACIKTSQDGKGRFLLFIFPLLFSFVPSILRWNFVALSESLSISFFVVFIAAWIMFLQTKRLSWLVSVAIIALLWAGVRDTNAYVLVMIVLVIIVALIRACSLKNVSMMALCVWFICIFILSDFSANAGSRWVHPLYKVLCMRILPVPEHVSFFSKHGMPVNPDLMFFSGKKANYDNWAILKISSLEEFRQWTHEHGKTTYIKFLITHFPYTITEPIFSVAKDFLSFAYYSRVHITDGTYRNINVPPTHNRIALIYFSIGYSVAICYVFIWWRRKHLYQCPYLVVPAVMVLLSAPHVWITWHGDAAETGRHSLLAFVQFQLGFILLLLYVWVHSRKSHLHNSISKPNGG